MGKRMSDGDEKISEEAAAEYERQRRIREVEERAAAVLAKHPQMSAQAAAWNDVQTVQAMAQAHQLQVPRLPLRPSAGARGSCRCWGGTESSLATLLAERSMAGAPERPA